MICLFLLPTGIYFTVISQNSFQSEISISSENVLIREGYELLDSGELVKAEAKFNEAKNLNPQSAVPWHGKAEVALAKQNLPVAMQYVDRALDIEEKHIPSLVLKIKILLLNGGDQNILAKKLANDSYRLSNELDQWLMCLEEQQFFLNIITTQNELDRLCPYFFEYYH